MASIKTCYQRATLYFLNHVVHEKPALQRYGLIAGKRKSTTMSASDGILLQDIVRQLGKFASTKLAESWDNVGLLVEPSGCHKVKRILLTNDLTQAVLDEAIKKSIQMIISYHPPIFVPLKRLSQGNWKERIIVKCIEHRIAIFSPHTSYDAVKGGVNDWLIQCFGAGDVQPLIPSTDTSYTKARANSCFKLVVKYDRQQSDQLDTIFSTLQSMQEVLRVEFKEFSPGSVEAFEVVVIPSELALAKVYDYVESSLRPSYTEVSRLDKLPLPGYGMGRIVQLKERITIENAIEKIKEHLEIQHVRLALARKAALSKQISSVAVCAGSGGSVLKGVSADLYVTGELSHHEVLHAVESGRSVILCEHSNSERGFLKTLAPVIAEWFKDEISVYVSLADKDPLSVI